MPKSMKCEARLGSGWMPMGVDEALRHRDLEMRCVECHGGVRPHKAGTTGQAAHFEHKRAHAGCSFGGQWNGSVRQRHPLALS